MTLPREGGCLCGAVRYRLTAVPIVTYTCHCTACQRITGSAFSAAMILPAEAVRFNDAETIGVARIAESGREVRRWVCAACLSWLCNGPKPGTAPAGSVVAVRA